MRNRINKTTQKNPFSLFCFYFKPNTQNANGSRQKINDKIKRSFFAISLRIMKPRQILYICHFVGRPVTSQTRYAGSIEVGVETDVNYECFASEFFLFGFSDYPRTLTVSNPKTPKICFKFSTAGMIEVYDMYRRL